MQTETANEEEALELGRNLATLTGGDAQVLGRLQWELFKALQEPMKTVEEAEESRISNLLGEVVRGFQESISAVLPHESLPEFEEYESAFLRTVIDCVLDPIFVKDEQHRWIFVNQAFCELMGQEREVLLGKSDYDFFPKEQADVFWAMDDQVLSTLEANENEEFLTDAHGEEHVLSTKKSAVWDFRGRKLLVGVIRDITGHRRLETQLRVAERLVALGTLAAGVAHEVNNPLAVVLSNLDFVTEELDTMPEGDAELVRALNSAQGAAERVQRIVHGLKTFAESGDETNSPQDVREIVSAVVKLMQKDICLRADLTEDYGEAPLVHANPGRLGQVILNILLNATQAMAVGHADENELRVETGISGDDAVITITDTGIGIPEDILDRIFDPFFTTKPVGEGTGLGLSISHNIVDAMGGHIEIESQIGEGTQIRIILPGATLP
ncbi:MAG: two-component system sensor histidine kinase NtrB [Bradymonadaceae bacterium]